jgi:hypothetical protein
MLYSLPPAPAPATRDINEGFNPSPKYNNEIPIVIDNGIHLLTPLLSKKRR